MDEEKLEEIENEKNAENHVIEDKGGHPIAPSKAVAWKANRRSQKRITKQVIASQAVGFSEFVPIPKPPPPTLNSTPIQRAISLRTCRLT